MIIFQDTNSTSKLNEIVSSIVLVVKSRCNGCQFGTEYIDKERFQCDPNEIHLVLFQGQIFSFTNKVIIGYISDWLTSGNASLVVGDRVFSLDESCNPTSTNVTFCIIATTNINSIVITSSISGFIILAILSIALIVLVVLLYRKKSKKELE